MFLWLLQAVSTIAVDQIISLVAMGVAFLKARYMTIIMTVEITVMKKDVVCDM